MTSSRTRWVRLAAVGAASALLITACGGGDDDKTPPADANAPVTIKVASWGEFGFKNIMDAFKAKYPNITVTLDAGDYAKHHENLQKFLVSNGGAPDVAAIDEGYILKFAAQADKFVNLNEAPYNAGDRKKDWANDLWKWNASMSGDKQIGLGTDIGGLAMCYRADLFKQAGLATDRTEVSALWPTWDDYIKVGQQYVTGIKDPKKKFVDSAVNIMNPVLSQQATGYFDKSETLQLGDDSGVKAAWDTTLKVLNSGISANLAAWSTEWDAGFKNGSFATIACPAWMMGYIQDKAPETKGNWDIADIPGSNGKRGGNWGGAYLTIPKQSKNKDAAWKFINFATDPAQLLTIFKTTGNLPSTSVLWNDPALVDFKKDFFNNAPVGKIFTDSANQLGEGQFLGKKNGDVRAAVEAVLTSVQQGKMSGDAAWAKAKQEAEKAAQG
ncbi:MAG: extracellular solute-binding protein [Kineosporiaceae bacterium]